MEEVMVEHGQPMPKQIAPAPESIIEEYLEKIEHGETEEELAVNELVIADESPLDTARKELQSAIDEERYEDAARLRDEIRKLEG